jgi:single-stranded-DNA-specific exonuclease
LTAPDVLPAFQEALRAAAQKHLESEDLTPMILIDADVELEHITWELFELLEKFQPFGVGNPEPRYVAHDLTIHSVEPMGTDGKHMRLHVRHKSSMVRKMVGFFCGEWCTTLKPGDKIDLVFEIGINEWNGTRELQLKIVDLKKQEATV